jgi:hypothetical protein
LAIGLGTNIGMYWKRHFKAPRPAQFYPAIMPIVPTPRHPSYPSNHSFQSHLIAELFAAVLMNDAGNDHGIAAPSRALADRIARNREIAGVHFESDSTAGKNHAVALAGFWKDLLIAAPPPAPQSVEDHMKVELAAIISDVKREWASYPSFQTPDQYLPFKTLADAIVQKMKAP